MDVTQLRLEAIWSGQRIALKKIKTDADFKAAAETCCTKGKTTADIIALGEKALVSLYGRRAGDALDMLRYKRLWEKVASSTTTVQDWIDKICDLKPEMWGWHLSSGRLDPCTTDLPPAPELLLKMIRCNCKSDCRSKRCTCRKHGLECSLACAECEGISCLNSPSPEPVADCDV
ncbi:hypothetical protein ElyMa_002244800 [Elysia marginata]|uniref:Tesmin/TSO1-like CXC domain-containing protein n=1 Tax=Elysia marginata TaxID=1093978 RepID=A0AAV4FWL6_9GAST|nr:hypothetical protein ElyMa_002244800 [Elysia marginata]